MSGATEAGGFRATNDPPSSYYRVALEVAYVEGAEPDVIRRALADVYDTALRELGRRLGGTQDNRRQPAGGERR